MKSSPQAPPPPLLLLLLLFHVFAPAVAHPEICNKTNNIFANCNAELQRCAAQHAEPVQFCAKCVQHYINFTASWQLLGSVHNANNESCIERFVNHDRLNLLLSVHGKTAELWNGASCSNCYETLANGTLTANQTEATTHLYALLGAMQACIFANNSTASEVCAECVGAYADLNDYYAANVQRSMATADEVCFDLRDAMNRTRRAWSDEFKCCRDRHESLLAFVLCSAAVAALPVVFYAWAVVQRRRADAREGPLLLDGQAELEGEGESDPVVGATVRGVVANGGGRGATGRGGGDGHLLLDDDVALLDASVYPLPSVSGAGGAAANVLIDLGAANEAKYSQEDLDIDDIGDDEEEEEEEDEIAKWKRESALKVGANQA